MDKLLPSMEVGNSSTTPVSTPITTNPVSIGNMFTMPVQSSPMLDIHAAASATKFHALMSEKFRDLSQMPMQDIEQFHVNPSGLMDQVCLDFDSSSQVQVLSSFADNKYISLL